MESQSTFESTTCRALRAAGVPERYINAGPRPDLLNGAYLYGKTGRGKTHAACGALRAFVQSHIIEVEGEFFHVGPRCRFVNAPDWFSMIRDTYGSRDKSEREVFERYVKCSLLVLDDLGKGEMTKWATDRLYLLVDKRCNANRPTIVTSNYGLAKVASMLTSDEETISAIASRILDTCDENGILMEGTDRRRRKIAENSHAPCAKSVL